MLTVSRFGSTTQNSCAPLERQRTAFSRISALVFEGDNTSITNSGEPRKLSSSSVASHLCCETYATSAPRRSPWSDHHVDRPEVYAQQCVQPTGTNRPRAWGSCSLWKARGVVGNNTSCGNADGRRASIVPLERKVSGDHSGRVTPVPIPNTEVKPDRKSTRL